MYHCSTMPMSAAHRQRDVRGRRHRPARAARGRPRVPRSSSPSSTSARRAGSPTRRRSRGAARTLVVFNGYANQYDHAPAHGATAGERVRIWVLDVGPEPAERLPRRRHPVRHGLHRGRLPAAAGRTPPASGGDRRLPGARPAAGPGWLRRARAPRGRALRRSSRTSWSTPSVGRTGCWRSPTDLSVRVSTPGRARPGTGRARRRGGSRVAANGAPIRSSVPWIRPRCAPQTISERSIASSRNGQWWSSIAEPSAESSGAKPRGAEHPHHRGELPSAGSLRPGVRGRDLVARLALGPPPSRGDGDGSRVGAQGGELPGEHPGEQLVVARLGGAARRPVQLARAARHMARVGSTLGAAFVDEHLQVRADGVRVQAAQRGELGDRQAVALVLLEQPEQLGAPLARRSARGGGSGDGHVCSFHC